VSNNNFILAFLISLLRKKVNNAMPHDIRLDKSSLIKKQAAASKTQAGTERYLISGTHRTRVPLLCTAEEDKVFVPSESSSIDRDDFFLIAF